MIKNLAKYKNSIALFLMAAGVLGYFNYAAKNSDLSYGAVLLFVLGFIILLND